MMIDMNGPDFEAVNEVKELILEFLKVWKNYKKMNELFTSYLPSPDHCNHMNDVKIPVQRCSNDDDDCTKQLIP